MNLNHLDLPVPRPQETAAFFSQHFGFTTVFAREDGLIVLLDESGFALTLSPLSADARVDYPSGFHVGFNVDCEDALFEVHRALIDAGVLIVRPMGELGGAMTFHCQAPGPVLVEIAYRPR